MRFAALLLACALSAAAQEKEALAVVQKLFDAMAAGDATAISSTMLADARLYAVREASVSPAITRDEFAQRIGSGKSHILERIWNPQTLIHGRIATVWAEYDVHIDGKFNHCGIDAFTLFQTAEGWKISSISYSSETQSCKPSPLGPPRKP